MQTIILTLWTYGLTIVFALLIAVVIQGVGVFIHSLASNRPEEVRDLSVPTADTEREQQALAVAIAVAHHAKRQPRS